MASTTTRGELDTLTRPLAPVPLTIEGSSVLHQMFRIRWPEWRKVETSEKQRILQEASAVLQPMEQNAAFPSALFSLLGHKGDLLLVHFRNSFEELKTAETRIAGLRLGDFLDQSTSYLSVVELGLY